MITNEEARIDAIASHASYGDAAIPAGYERVDPVVDLGVVPLDDPKTGFHAALKGKRGKRGQVKGVGDK